MKFTFEKKILAGFILCVFILLIIVVVSLKNGEQFIDTNQKVAHTYEVLFEFEQVQVSSVEAETGARGFIITGKEDYLEPFNNGKVDLLEHLDKLKGLTADNPAQKKNVAEIEEITDAHIKHLESCIAVRREDFETAKEMVKTGESRRLLVAIRKRIAHAKEVEQQLLIERKDASERDSRNFNLVFIVLLTIIVTVLLVVYFIIIANLKARIKAETEIAEKNWILMGSGELIKNMQGNKHMFQLVQIIINHLALYLNAQIGAVYLLEEDCRQLKLAGGYAIDKRKKEAPAVTLGEGIVGQCAAENRIMQMTDIPAEHFIVDTGFGEVIPKNILVVPLVFEEKVVGVIELGSIVHFTEIQNRYIQLAADSIAIAITSAQARAKMTALLEETQRQAEELQVQQEELRLTNEELQEKTELLERSETELKTQQEELQQSNEELLEKTTLLEKSEAELRAQQEELQQANQELEEKANMLEEQKGTLESTKMEIENKARELEEVSKYKSEFLANMSHELRTPLNSILILAQLLCENKSNVLRDKEVSFARNIYTSGTDLLNLINEILDLSKVEAGKMELDIAPVACKEIISDVNSMFSELAKKKSIDFTIETADDITDETIVATDKQRLEQVIKNLLSNAFKFTAQDGVVSLKIARPPLSISFTYTRLREVQDIIAFSVTDNGIGIPVEKQGIIFEAFQQADGSTKRKYGGTGLGLSICRELANALGGEIRLTSEEGKGSIFTFYLPVQFNLSVSAPDNNRVALKEGVQVKERASNDIEEIKKVDETRVAEEGVLDDRNSIQENDKIVLIMEDDVSFANLLLEFVRERRYKGVLAFQGNTGLSYARHYRPDAIILDMKLPVMDGAEVLKQLKSDPLLRHIPVQIISGYDRRREGMELGAFDYVRKPVSKENFQLAFDRIEDFVTRKLKRLLIVEDNELQNKAICELIGNGDVKCFSVYSGKEAFDLMKREKFDCTIVDLGLPDMSGFDLLERIKADDQLNKVPTIVYTGKDLTKEESNRLNKLANTVVLKTVDSKERLFDETTLFLHRVESRLPKEKQNIIRKLHKTDEVLQDKKVLVVDDDMRNIYSLTNVLEEEGMNCLIAENGKVAVKMLKENTVDIVLMDIMMPEMDGYEATKEIRKLNKLEKLPVIALTAKAMKGDREKCLAAGMSDYISKPVDVEKLLSLMRVWLYR